MEPGDEDFLRSHEFKALDKSIDGTIRPVRLNGSIRYSINNVIVSKVPKQAERGLKAKAQWLGLLCIAGVGLFVQAYFVITTGQLKTVWKNQYPECYAPHKYVKCTNKIVCCGLFPNTPVFNSTIIGQDGRIANDTCAIPQSVLSEHCDANGHYPSDVLCSPRVSGAISYTAFAGLMGGMILFGMICDLIGRRNASMMTALLEIVGVCIMAFYENPVIQQQVIIFSTFYGLFGLGVGGEYPLAASGAAQHQSKSIEQQEYEAEHNETEKMRKRLLMEQVKTNRRGETIALVFAMQGVGAVFGSIVLLILIHFAGQGSVQCNDPKSTVFGSEPSSLNTVWRTFYFIGLLMILMMLVNRWLSDEPDGRAALMERKRLRAERLGKTPSVFSILRFYMFRLMGTGGCWFLWDVTFYGLKLFSGPIFNDINPEGGLLMNNIYLLLTNVVAVAGGLSAAKVIDGRRVGRVRLQATSFVVLAICFGMCGALFDQAISDQRPAVVIFLYFAIAFFGQFGPGVTTYVIAAETYPTELRATCHGLSAFMGKAGALMATILFNSKSTKEIFFFCGFASIVGVIITLLFSVDLTRVSLAEHEAQLELFLAGRLDEYKGALNERKHLSWFEICFGVHGEYHPHWLESFDLLESGATCKIGEEVNQPKLLTNNNDLDGICEEASE